MSNPPKKLKVGILVDDLSVNQYTYDLVKYLINSEKYCNPVIFHDFKKSSEALSYPKKILYFIKKNGFLNLLKFIIKILVLMIVTKLERSKARGDNLNPGARYDLMSLNNLSFCSLAGHWSKSGLYLSFLDHDLRKIRNLDLDVLVRNNSGILRGDVLSVTKFGIISFHHGDNRVNRGGPSGFWEVLLGEASSGFIIQQLENELDGGKVLFRGNIMTKRFWFLNNLALLRKSNVFMMKVLDHIAENRCLPEVETPMLHDRALYREPGLTSLLIYMRKVYGNSFIKKILFKLGYEFEDRWNIAFVRDMSLGKSLWRYKKVLNPPRRFLADPFLIEHGDRHYIFAEDYCYAKKRGRISALEVVGEETKFLGVVLQEEFHLSFPFMFKDNDDIFMIPESSAKNQIRLYRAKNFPLDWEFVCVLMDDVSAADTMIIKKLDKYFMLTNICSAKIGDHNSELHVFHSSNLRGNQWLPTKQGNPIFCDSLRARNGGLYFLDESLYRINQVQGKNHYGQSFVQNKVLQLDEDGYSETALNQIEPRFRGGIISTHHFNANNGLAVIDFCTKEKLKNIMLEK